MTKVLVVEDEESFSEAISFMLRKEGFEVAVAADGNAALVEFDKGGADIVLLDLMLPGLSGTEVCREIRKRSSTPETVLPVRNAVSRDALIAGHASAHTSRPGRPSAAGCFSPICLTYWSL